MQKITAVLRILQEITKLCHSFNFLLTWLKIGDGRLTLLSFLVETCLKQGLRSHFTAMQFDSILKLHSIVDDMKAEPSRRVSSMHSDSSCGIGQYIHADYVP
jgi:hypothetical protein